MCFIIQAEVIGTKAADRKAFEAPVPGTQRQVEWYLSDTKGKPLQLGVKGNCTCILVAGGRAAENPTIWPLRSEWVPRIVRAVEWLYDQSPKGIVVWAIFFGDAPRNERACSIDELLTLLEGHEIANRTRYVVRKRR